MNYTWGLAWDVLSDTWTACGGHYSRIYTRLEPPTVDTEVQLSRITHSGKLQKQVLKLERPQGHPAQRWGEPDESTPLQLDPEDAGIL